MRYGRILIQANRYRGAAVVLAVRLAGVCAISMLPQSNRAAIEIYAFLILLSIYVIVNC